MSTTERPTAFVPGGARAAERGAASVVSRFAAPVRALGSRTLGFVDRFFSTRLAFLQYGSAHHRPFGQGSIGLLFPIPWYDVNEQDGEPIRGSQRLAAATMSRSQAMRSAIAPIDADKASFQTQYQTGVESVVSQAAAYRRPELMLLDSAQERAAQTGAAAPHKVDAVTAAPHHTSEAVSDQTPTHVPALPQATGPTSQTGDDGVVPPIAGSTPPIKDTAIAAVTALGRSAEPAVAALPRALRSELQETSSVAPRIATSSATMTTPHRSAPGRLHSPAPAAVPAFARPLILPDWVDARMERWLGKDGGIPSTRAAATTAAPIEPSYSNPTSNPMQATPGRLPAMPTFAVGSAPSQHTGQPVASPLPSLKDDTRTHASTASFDEFRDSRSNVPASRREERAAATSPAMPVLMTSTTSSTSPSSERRSTHSQRSQADEVIIRQAPSSIDTVANAASKATDSPAPTESAKIGDAAAPFIPAVAAVAPRTIRFLSEPPRGLASLPELRFTAALDASLSLDPLTDSSQPLTTTDAAALPAAATVASSVSVLGSGSALFQHQTLAFLERLTGLRTAEDTRPLPVATNSPVYLDFEYFRATSESPIRSGQARLTTAAADVPPQSARGKAQALIQQQVSADAPSSSATSRFASSATPRFADLPVVTASPVSAGQPALDSYPATASTALSLGGREKAPWRPGNMAVHAEQLAGSIGIRAAGLSLDFIDPADVSRLSTTEDRKNGARAAGPALMMLGNQASAGSARERNFNPAIGATSPSPITADLRPSASRFESALTATWALSQAFHLASLHSAPTFQSVPARTLVEGTAFPFGDIFTNVVAPPSTFAADGRPSVPKNRLTLSDGRVPRGSYTWSSAASFSNGTRPLALPALSESAVAIANAAHEGQPLWSAIPGTSIPPAYIAEALAPRAGARPTLSLVRTSSAPGAVSGDAANRLASHSVGWNEDKAPTLSGPAGGLPSGSSVQSDHAASYIQQLIATGSTSGATTASVTSVLNATPRRTESEAPVGRILEALRSQHQGASDDRVTLADLALVEVAAATQQLAASPAGGSGNSSSSRNSSSGTSSGRSASPEQGKSPEAERAEIESLARQVVDELRSIMAVSLERSGESWES